MLVVITDKQHGDLLIIIWIGLRKYLLKVVVCII